MILILILILAPKNEMILILILENDIDIGPKFHNDIDIDIEIRFWVCGHHSKRAEDDVFWIRGCAGSTDLVELRRKHMFGPGK